MVPRAQPAEIPRVHTELTWDTVDTWDSIWKLAHAALNESPTGFMTIPQITHAIAIRNTTRFDVVNPKPLKSSLSNNLTLSADFDRFKTPGIRLSSWYLTGSQRGVERPDKKRARQQAKAAKGKRRSTRGAEAAQPTNEQPQASSSHAHIDVQGSIAYAKALQKSGLLSSLEADKITEGLTQVGEEWKAGRFEIKPDDEDIHTANERRLSELIGPLGGKLHTGRSRNDQVATDMRLWLLEEVKDIESSLRNLISVMVERADKEKEYLMPGYTHLQTDLQRLKQLIPRISVLPLGSGALAGNPYGIDREFLAKELGFQSIAENSMWGVADRDFIVEFLMWSTMAMGHISRLAEDFIIYSTAEFGFITLSDAYSTGSSIMPQKKNPDSLELLRGKCGRIFGDMAGFVVSLKGLPSTYNKDLQEDKEPLFDAVDTIAACFKITEGVLATLEVHPEKMRNALTMDMLATDLADYLVRKGIPFRETHHISGRAVALAESRKVQLNDLSVEDYQKLSDKFDDDVHGVFDFEKSVENRNAIGGTSIQMIDRQVATLRKALA
ncbi:argininosuccinate lyase [Tulasnella sp. 403]|nr:argininosuccinate lyase [Tulasnella sp. 403]